jgi:hypothetical protein
LPRTETSLLLKLSKLIKRQRQQRKENEKLRRRKHIPSKKQPKPRCLTGEVIAGLRQDMSLLAKKAQHCLQEET